MTATEPAAAGPDAPVVISVRGERNLEVDPELCDFTVTLRARGPERAGVLASLSQRNSDALAQLKGTWGEALEQVQTSGFSVYPETKPKSRNEQVKAYAGTVRLTVTVKDFTVLGDMILRVSDAEGRSVDGPYWRMRRDSPAYRQARTEAVADAVARAKEYAAAIGARITGLLELADDGTSMTHGVQPMRAQFGVRSASYSEAPTLELEPVRQTVYAAVQARFSATQPEEL